MIGIYQDEWRVIIMAKDFRFEVIHKEKSERLESWIIKDNETGALYYQTYVYGRGIALTALNGANGKPLIEKDE